MIFIEELLITFSYSKRAQLAAILGPIFFVAIMLLGHHLTSNLVFEGVMAPMTEIFRSAFMMRYEYLAWFALITFWVIAAKALIRDRKKYLY